MSKRQSPTSSVALIEAIGPGDERETSHARALLVVVGGGVALLILFACSVLENFGYRQINVVWRLIGTWQWLRGKQGGWGAMQRKGMETKKT